MIMSAIDAGTWSGEGRRQSQGRKQSWKASGVVLFALAPALLLAKPTAAVKKGAAPRAGEEKGKLVGKAKGFAKVKDVEDGRDRHGGPAASAPHVAAIPSMEVGVPSGQALPAYHGSLHPARLPPSSGGCVSEPAAAPGGLQSGVPEVGPVPILREEDLLWQHGPSTVSGLHNLVVNPGEYLEYLVYESYLDYAAMAQQRFWVVHGRVVCSMGEALKPYKRPPSTASGGFGAAHGIDSAVVQQFGVDQRHACGAAQSIFTLKITSGGRSGATKPPGVTRSGHGPGRGQGTSDATTQDRQGHLPRPPLRDIPLQ